MGLGCLRNITEALRQPEQGALNIKLNEFPNDFVSEFFDELISSMELQFQALYIWWWLTAAQKDQIQSVQICICRSGEWNDKYIKICFMIFSSQITDVHWDVKEEEKYRKVEPIFVTDCVAREQSREKGEN